MNDYTDFFLEEHGFSREEIRQGVLDVAKRMADERLPHALIGGQGSRF